MAKVKARPTKGPQKDPEDMNPQELIEWAKGGGLLEWQEDQVESAEEDPLKAPLLHILKNAEETGELNQEDIDAFLSEAIPGLEGSQDRANLYEHAAYENLYNIINDPRMEVGQQDMADTIESQAALAEADPDAIAGQQWTLDELKELSSPEITAEERFMMEMARRQQEAEVRSRREAALADLGARGVRSGAAEMTALLGAESATAGNRQLQDLGAQANAVQRAMEALGMHGDMATTMRRDSFSEDFATGGAADAIAEFNANMTNEWNQFREKREAEERDALLEREAMLSDALIGRGEREFGREHDVANFKGEGTGMKVGERLKGTELTTDALTSIYADQEKEKAIRELKKKKKGLFGTGIGPDFTPFD